MSLSDITQQVLRLVETRSGIPVTHLALKALFWGYLRHRDDRRNIHIFEIVSIFTANV